MVITTLRRAAALAALSFAAAAHAAPPSAGRYIVQFNPGMAGPARAALTLAGARVALELRGHDAVAVELPAGALAALQRNPNIAYVEQDAPRYPLALAEPSGPPYAAGQLEPYGIRMVQADLVSDGSAGSRTVCVIDSGLDRTHEDLDGVPVTGNDDVGGAGDWDTDENHHGTHVAGTIAALNNANVGVVGVAPNAQLKLHIVKVFDADGWAYTSSLVAATDRCRAALSNVISMSLGGSVSSRFEKTAFDKLYADGILSVAAAGNGGNNRNSYPASYASVMSVAAVDSAMNRASFSQYNKQVEIAAPGVGVLSTVPMGSGRDASTVVGGTAYESAAMDGSPVGSGSGPLVDCGLGTSQCSAAGKVCLIQRGTNTFAEKVLNCQAGGGVAAVIYNNVAGMLYGTLGGTATGIASVGISDTDGAALKGKVGQSATVGVSASNYAYFDGTSMATPHVSAVAALIWSHRTGCKASHVRKALTATARDLGVAGRDNYYGHGLVQALGAKNYLLANPC